MTSSVIPADSPVRTRSVRLVGDIFVSEEDPGQTFAATRELLRGGDVLIGNLEVPLCDVGAPLPKSNGHLRSEPRMVQALTAAGMTAVTVANNHAMNYGEDGLDQTLRVLDDAGIGHAGGGTDSAAAHAPFVGQVRGWRYAVLSYTSVYARGMFEARADRGGLATVKVDTAYQPRERHLEVPGLPPIIRTDVDAKDVARVQSDIVAIRDHVDAVIVCWHWGVSVVAHDVVQYQREMGRMAIDAGADAVVGHHPHSLQPIDFHHGKPICYCIGNFHHALGAADFPSESIVLELLFHGGHSEPAVRVHPLWLDRGAHPAPLALDDPRCERVLAQLGHGETSWLTPADGDDGFDVAEPSLAAVA